MFGWFSGHNQCACGVVICNGAVRPLQVYVCPRPGHEGPPPVGGLLQRGGRGPLPEEGGEHEL